MTNARQPQSFPRVGAAAVAASAFLIGFMTADAGGAQSKPETPAFEVASIKPSDPTSNRVGFQLTPAGLNATNVTLAQLITFAYNIPCGKNATASFQEGPAGFDRLGSMWPPGAILQGRLECKHPAPVRRIIRPRLQSLLDDRFQLVLRRMKKEMSVYALVVAKGGSRMKAAPDGPGALAGGHGHSEARNVTMETFAISLAGQLGRPVVDRTGLKGGYNFTLDYALESAAMPKPADASGDKSESPGAAEVAGPSIFTALQEQLGLKLESSKDKVEILVIERAEKPGEN